MRVLGIEAIGEGVFDARIGGELARLGEGGGVGLVGVGSPFITVVGDTEDDLVRRSQLGNLSETGAEVFFPALGRAVDGSNRPGLRRGGTVEIVTHDDEVVNVRGQVGKLPEALGLFGGSVGVDV